MDQISTRNSRKTVPAIFMHLCKRVVLSVFTFDATFSKFLFHCSLTKFKKLQFCMDFFVVVENVHFETNEQQKYFLK